MCDVKNNATHCSEDATPYDGGTTQSLLGFGDRYTSHNSRPSLSFEDRDFLAIPARDTARVQRLHCVKIGVIAVKLQRDLELRYVLQVSTAGRS